MNLDDLLHREVTVQDMRDLENAATEQRRT
jgi:hypothetical protein